MSYIWLPLLGTIVCAIIAVHARPLVAALWLAGSSALLAIALYLVGATALAVIELSVGAGLITVLIAFAISMAEDETLYRPVIPRWLSLLLVAAAVGALGWLLWPGLSAVQPSATTDLPFYEHVWVTRQADLMLQIVIIFAGVIGILNLLADVQTSNTQADEPAEVLS